MDVQLLVTSLPGKQIAAEARCFLGGTPTGGGAGLWDSRLKPLSHRHPRRPRAGGIRRERPGKSSKAVGLARRAPATMLSVDRPQDLAGVHDVLGIERLLDRAH